MTDFPLVRPARWVVEGGHDYLTERIHDEALPVLDIVGMNPGRAPVAATSAGQYTTFATGIAAKHGFGGIRFLNHWTIVESDSIRALAHPDKVGPRADEFLHEVLAAQPGVPVLGAWGDAVAKVDDLCGYRVRTFIELAATYDRPILCAGVNLGSGQPRHLSSFRPKRVEDVELRPWTKDVLPSVLTATPSSRTALLFDPGSAV